MNFEQLLMEAYESKRKLELLEGRPMDTLTAQHEVPKTPQKPGEQDPQNDPSKKHEPGKEHEQPGHERKEHDPSKRSERENDD